jgi:hypothetical protein
MGDEAGGRAGPVLLVGHGKGFGQPLQDGLQPGDECQGGLANFEFLVVETPGIGGTIRIGIRIGITIRSKRGEMRARVTGLGPATTA